MIRHIVAMRYREDTLQEVRDQLMADLKALDAHIDGIQDFQVRRNISPEAPVVRGFLDLFWIDFADVAARDAYLDDPAHKAAGARLVAALEGGADGLFVYDFEL